VRKGAPEAAILRGRAELVPSSFAARQAQAIFRESDGSATASFVVSVSPEKRPFRFSKKSTIRGLLTAHFSHLATGARDDKKGSRAFDWPVVRTRA
jgi:hypothetical protein